MVETLLDTRAAWASASGPDDDVVICSSCRLLRNFSDFPFPGQCSRADALAIEERVLGVLEGLHFLSTGKYWPFAELTELELRFLGERRIVPMEALVAREKGGSGIYIADDQSLGIVVNGGNHVELRALGAGLCLQGVWTRLNLADDQLAGLLDFAFTTRLGFLTARLGDLGTALEGAATLHLPGLAAQGELPMIEELVREKRHLFQPLFNQRGNAAGDVYRVSNISTLGRSEEEILFHLRNLVAGSILSSERDARARLASEAPLRLEDMVGRALGIARGARLLEFREALSVWSSLRLGVSRGMMDSHSLPSLNEVLLMCQPAHLEMRHGQANDEAALNAERAELFRARFS